MGHELDTPFNKIGISTLGITLMIKKLRKSLSSTYYAISTLLDPEIWFLGHGGYFHFSSYS